MIIHIFGSKVEKTQSDNIKNIQVSVNLMINNNDGLLLYNYNLIHQ